MVNVVPLFEHRNARPAAKITGTVTLVGAGPGDPDLLTRKACAAISAADIVFYDDLVSPEVLAEVPSQTPKHYVGKPQGGAQISQAEIGALLINAVQKGQRVVRLKGGDPMIFGRGGEEVDALVAAGVQVEVIPGITAAQAAASVSRIPLTHRDRSAQVTYVTAHRADGDLANVRGLAGEERTLVVYMGVRQAGALRAALLQDGVAPSLPVAVVEKATRPGQRVFITDVDTLPAVVADERIVSPALFIVGRVAATASALTCAGGNVARAAHG